MKNAVILMLVRRQVVERVSKVLISFCSDVDIRERVPHYRLHPRVYADTFIMTAVTAGRAAFAAPNHLPLPVLFVADGVLDKERAAIEAFADAMGREREEVA